MLLKTTIRQFNTDIPFTMQVCYKESVQKWALVFTSQSRKVQKREEHIENTFEDVMRRFRSNCRYYGVEEPEYITEEEFMALPVGILHR